MASKIKQTVDLIPAKAKNLELPSGKIAIEVSSEMDSSTFARIMEPVWKYLNDYRKVAVKPLIDDYDAKVGKAKDAAEAEKLTSELNAKLTKLTKSLEAEAQKRADAAFAKGKKEDAKYIKYKLAIGAKISIGVVKIGKAIGVLVATAGALGTEYITVAKSVVGIAAQLRKALDDEEAVREQVMAAMEKVAKSKDADQKAGKGKVDAAKSAVKLYQQKLTGVKQKAASLAKELDKLLAKKEGATPKQAKAVDSMVKEIAGFNSTEKAGRDFADNALAVLKDAKKRLDLAAMKGYSGKAKKAFGAARKGLELASNLI